MKKAVCDNCGAEDDVVFGGVPMLPRGMVIQIRSMDGGDEIASEKELCEDCATRVLDAFPKLREAE